MQVTVPAGISVWPASVIISATRSTALASPYRRFNDSRLLASHTTLRAPAEFHCSSWRGALRFAVSAHFTAAWAA